jgi:hypothetical protein
MPMVAELGRAMTENRLRRYPDAAVTATAANPLASQAGEAITSATPLTSPGNPAIERETTRGGDSMQRRAVR